MEDEDDAAKGSDDDIKLRALQIQNSLCRAQAQTVTMPVTTLLKRNRTGNCRLQSANVDQGRLSKNGESIGSNDGIRASYSSSSFAERVLFYLVDEMTLSQ
jgi:hypothetical protein